MWGLPQLFEVPWPHVLFASLHLVAGQGLSAWLFRRRFGGSPLVIYRRGQQTAHMRRTRGVAAATLVWAASFLAYAFWPAFRESLAGQPLFPAPMAVGWGLGLAGLVGMLASQLDMGASFRVGQDDAGAPTRLVTTGIHARSRHPVYVASFLYLAALSLWSPCALTLAALAAVGGCMHLLALAEEAHLARVHGDAWTDYAAKTRRYL